MRARLLSTAVLLAMVATLGMAHATGPCTVATDSSTDANPGVVGYDSAVELTALRMSADTTTMTIEWAVKNLSAPLPVLAQGRDYTLGWFVGDAGNHVTVSWTPKAGWTTTAGSVAADATANVVRARVPLSVFGLADGDVMTDMRATANHEPGFGNTVSGDFAPDSDFATYEVAAACA